MFACISGDEDAYSEGMFALTKRLRVGDFKYLLGHLECLTVSKFKSCGRGTLHCLGTFW